MPSPWGLRTVAHDNVSAFVTAAVRNELDRRRLLEFVYELEEELGPADEIEAVKYGAVRGICRARQSSQGRTVVTARS